MRRILTTAVLAAAALVVASAAAAAPSPSYQVTAVGTGTQFIGVAVGSAGDRGSFRATVAPGGALSLRTAAAQIDGSFTGSTLTPRSQAAGTCGTQQLDVSGSVFGSSGSLDFTGVVTQIRLRILGQCRTIVQTLQGSLTESIGQF